MNMNDMPTAVTASDQERLKLRYAFMQARFLTQVDTEFLMAAVVDPAFKSTGARRLRLMMLLEIGHRMNMLSSEYKWNCYRAVYGAGAPHIPLSALTAPSEGLAHEGESAFH